MLGRFVKNTVTDLPWVKKFDQGIDTAPPTWSGQHVTIDSAQQLLIVYGATAFHADHCSTMPIDQFRKRSDGSREQVATSSWLDEPFPGLDITDALSQMWWSYWMGGHALAPLIRDQLGRPAGFLPLHPDSWRFDVSGGAPRVFVNGRPMGGEFISIPHVLVPGSWRGVNPIEAARQTIGLGLGAAEFSGGFFARGQTMSGVIEMPGAAPSPDDLKLMRDNWVKTYGGSSRSHLPGMLFGGAQWKQLSVTPEQAQFLETRGFTDAQICTQLFQLPTSAMGVSMPTGGTVEYSNVTMNWEEVVRRWIPHLAKFKRAFSKVLPRPQYVEFNVDRYLAASTKERFETYEIGVRSGVLLPDEAREIENRPPLPPDAARPASAPPALPS